MGFFFSITKIARSFKKFFREQKFIKFLKYNAMRVLFGAECLKNQENLLNI